MKNRPGDQQLPMPNEEPPVHDLVCEDLQERKKIGIKRYGVPLQPFNGRDSSQDAYEEILDLAVYHKQVRTEWDWLGNKVYALYRAHMARNTPHQSQIIHEIAERMGWKSAE